VLNHDNQNKIDNVYYTATNKQNKIINSNNLTYNNNNK
jgi:hypothetical protein